MNSRIDQARADALGEVTDAAKHREAVTAEADRRFRAAICCALAVGIRASAIATAAGITRGRVYQIRDGRR